MPPPWVAGARARIIGEIHGQTTVNVMHFATNDQIVDDDNLDDLLLALAEAIKDCVITTLLPAVTSDWRFVRSDAQRIYPVLSDPIIASGAPEHVGELSAASVSFQASVVTLRTGSGGRRGRGRLFLPPAGEAQIANSVIDGPTMVLLAEFLTCVGLKFLGAAPTTPWRLGILSQKDLNGIIGNFDNSFRVVSSLNTNADVGVMRSRRKGRGI